MQNKSTGNMANDNITSVVNNLFMDIHKSIAMQPFITFACLVPVVYNFNFI